MLLEEIKKIKKLKKKMLQYAKRVLFIYLLFKIHKANVVINENQNWDL